MLKFAFQMQQGHKLQQTKEKHDLLTILETLLWEVFPLLNRNIKMYAMK